MSPRLALLPALVLVSACTPSVRDVCDKLDDADNVSSCFDDDFSYTDCVSDGEYLQDTVNAKGCGDLFDDYLSCLDAEVCDAFDACATDRAALESCTGEFTRPEG